MEEKIKIEEFERWLLDNWEKEVGVAFFPWNCPIANWLKTVFKCKVSTSGDVIWVGDDANSVTMVTPPEWVLRFVTLFDKSLRDYGIGVVVPVTGEYAYGILKTTKAALAFEALTNVSQ